jgi:hypothetical protein
MWSSIRNGGSLGVPFEGFGIEERVEESQPETQSAEVQIRMLLRARCWEKSKGWNSMGFMEPER